MGDRLELRQLDMREYIPTGPEEGLGDAMRGRAFKSSSNATDPASLAVSEDSTEIERSSDDSSVVVVPKPIPSTRASRTWMRILPALVLLAIILLFVLENLGTTTITFLNLSGKLPLAIALLASAALGALVVLALGSVRIIQLRKLVHSPPELVHPIQPQRSESSPPDSES